MDERRNWVAPGGSTPPRMSGTKRAAQSTPGRGFQPSSSAGRMVPPSSSGQMMPSGSSGRMMPSGSSGRMMPPGSRPYVPAHALGLAHRKRTSYPFTQPLAPPQGQRPRQFYGKRPARPTFNDSSPISARRIMASTISAPMPVKAAQHNLPYWQVNDSASARATDSRRFAAMTVGDRSATPGSDYRDITDKKYNYSNQDVRREYDANSVPRHFGRKAARKTEEQAPDEESTSESSESESDNEDNEDDWESVPESDQDSEPDKPDSDPEDVLSDGSIEIIDQGPFKPPVIELLDDTPPMSPSQTPRLLTPPEEIIAAIEGLALSAACMQELHRLPFLKRNVRRGFLNYCRARGVPIESENTCPSITVVFKLMDSELPPYEASISCYECPLCQLHLPFQTREMFQTHLDLAHAEVMTAWDEIDDKGNWRLVLLLPSRIDDGHVPPSPGIQVFPPGAQPEPIPPPPDPLGPTARFPFLPAKSEYGGSDVKYSVRFGGPKIYDLLGTLPMEPYGILGWAVLDREEEIFESDDIPDEHKVMHALWGRWIFFNRNLFISHYFNGAKSFIDQYWKMIRLAAGWDALRYWLLMLSANRFLTGRDVALLLRRYEAWCSED